MGDTADLPDTIRADAERLDALRAAVRQRLAQIEESLPKVLKERHRLADAADLWKQDPRTQALVQEKLAGAVTEIELLVREHAALEAMLDRQDARMWRRVQFFAGAGVGWAATLVLTKLFG